MDNIICFFTASRYSHAELVMSYDDQTKAGLCFSSSSLDGGVRSKYMTLNPERWEIIEYNTNKSSDEILEFFHKENGKKYDYLGAIGVVFPSISALYGDRNKWFCFEIVGAALGFQNSSDFTGDDLLWNINHEAILRL